MELRIDELRKERRPLWMTGFGVESFGDILGGGGDIYSDRLSVDSARGFGHEDNEPEELDPKDVEILLTSGHYDDCCIS